MDQQLSLPQPMYKLILLRVHLNMPITANFDIRLASPATLNVTKKMFCYHIHPPEIIPTFVQIIFGSLWVAEWPPFGKELHAWMTISSLCILLFNILVISEGGI